jgi:PAS domain S-box-containing protein
MLCELPDVVRALKKEELVPFFQPVVELRTGGLKGFEVLARWRHPEAGAILPENFISLAEENGLIDEVSRQVCDKALAMSSLLAGDLTLAVNVSPIQMHDRGLPLRIRRAAEAASFPLSRLIIEITESALYQDLEQAQQVAGSLKAMGCRLALDDFGTGYSNLRHLHFLNFDLLKIDRSFVSGITTQRDSRKIVAAIIGLGHSLHLQMTAEGVETEEQAAMLIWLGCDFGQGWRYGKPVPAEDLPRMIAAEPIPMLPALTAPGDDWATSSLEALPTLRLAQLQAIYDGAPVGLCFLDNSFRYISLNQRLADMNGAPVKSHVGKTVQEMYPAWFAVFEPYLLRARGGEAISGVTFHRPGAGPGDLGMDLLASYQPAWDEADEVVGISISILDVTQHRQSSQAALQVAGAHPDEIKVNPETPWVMDAEGNNLQVSSRWVQTIPLGKDRTRNLHWLEALHIGDLEHTIKAMKHALRTGEAIDVEYRVLSVDGDWRWMRSRGSPRFGPSGEIMRWYGSVEDIHDQKLHPKDATDESRDASLDDRETLARGPIGSETLQHSVEDQATPDRQGRSSRPG